MGESNIFKVLAVISLAKEDEILYIYMRVNILWSNLTAYIKDSSIIFEKKFAISVLIKY